MSGFVLRVALRDHHGRRHDALASSPALSRRRNSCNFAAKKGCQQGWSAALSCRFSHISVNRWILAHFVTAALAPLRSLEAVKNALCNMSSSIHYHCLSRAARLHVVVSFVATHTPSPHTHNTFSIPSPHTPSLNTPRRLQKKIILAAPLSLMTHLFTEPSGMHMSAKQSSKHDMNSESPRGLGTRSNDGQNNEIRSVSFSANSIHQLSERSVPLVQTSITVTAPSSSFFLTAVL